MQGGLAVDIEALHQDALGLSEEVADGEAIVELGLAAGSVERDGDVDGEDLAELCAVVGKRVRGVGARSSTRVG